MHRTWVDVTGDGMAMALALDREFCDERDRRRLVERHAAFECDPKSPDVQSTGGLRPPLGGSI